MNNHLIPQNKAPPTPQMPFSPNANNPASRRPQSGILQMPHGNNTGQAPPGIGMKSPFRGGATPGDAENNYPITAMTPGYGNNALTTSGSMGIVGMVDDGYSNEPLNDSKLYHKQIVRVDSNMVGAKGTTQVQEGVRRQYEDSIPELVISAQNEMDLTNDQLHQCSEHLTTQIEKLDSIQNGKVLPTLLHQLAVIYKAPLPEVKQNTHNNNEMLRKDGFDVYSFDSDKMIKAGDRVVQMNGKIAGVKGKTNEIVMLPNYIGGGTADAGDRNNDLLVTGNNLAEVTATMTTFRHPGFELPQHELDQLQQTLRDRYKEAVSIRSRK